MVNINFDALKKCLDEYMNRYIQERVFPGAAIGISSLYNGFLEKSIICYGNSDDSNDLVDENTFYDCASLTKPLVTVLSILSLIQEKKISWEDKLESLICLNVPADKKKISLIQLMSHASGLPAYKPFFRELFKIDPIVRRKEVVRLILKENLLFLPGKESVYSDLGYILLGLIVEEKSNRSLDEYWKTKVTMPFMLQDDLIFSKNRIENSKKFASTGYCLSTKSKLSGIVHDENCRSLGGVSGHAGLFGTVRGVLLLCEKILLSSYNKKEDHVFSNETMVKALTKRNNSSWALGFDTPSQTGSSSGKYFSKNSVGHLGFTGTSFWIDIKKKIIVVILTNRVFFDVQSEKIKKARPIIHNTIMKKILGKQ